jgi:hypothetical protein
MGGIDSGEAPPPIPSGGLLQVGRTRRRPPRPVPRRRGWRRRARASGERGVCLGGSWDRGESSRLIDGGFYRPGRRRRGRPVVRRCGGPGRVRRATLGTAALLACWRGSVSAAECCGSALAQSRWSATCSDLGKKRGGSWVLSPLLLPFSRLGSGQRELGSTAASSRGMATGVRQTATVIFTVNSISPISVCQMFDEMPARDSNSNF